MGKNEKALIPTEPESFVTHRLFTDGAARGNPGPAGAGAVLFDGDRQVKTLSHYLGDKLTNNESEYRALIIGLEMALSQGASKLEVLMDSQLIVNQLLGKYKIKQPHLRVLANETRKLTCRFESINFTHIERKLNKQADKLANLA
ncbi:MAG: ribonuclease HI family protein, partial [Candidatus Altiarchaeota archaeon]|nr:ribonuclease HI family protein [Candidatus Altiarchaeota archaeon]